MKCGAWGDGGDGGGDSSIACLDHLLRSDHNVPLQKRLCGVISRKQPRLLLPNERCKMERYESVDTYEPSTTVYKDHLESRSQEPRWFIWVFVMVLGIGSSAIAIAVVSTLHMLNDVRYELLGFGLRGFSFDDPNRYVDGAVTNHSRLDVAAMFKGAGVGLYGIEPRSYTKGYLMWISFSLVMSLLSSLICALVPESVGSGLPEVIAYLNGVHYPMLDSLRVLVAKVCSITLSVASGVCTGHLGTLILTGAMLGAQVLRRRRQFRCDSMNIIECFRNPRDRRTIIVIGTAAGVASAFSVSIGGLMVVVELISTILPTRFALYVFAASLLSSLMLQAYFSYFMYFDIRDRSSYPSGELISNMVLSFASRVPFKDVVRMHIFYFVPTIVIGIVCGVLAGVYVRLSWLALKLRRHLERRWKTKAVRYVLPIVFTFVYITINYWVAVVVGSGGWSPSPSCTNDQNYHHPKQPDQMGDGSLQLTSNNTARGVCVAVPMTLLNSRNVSVIAYYGANGFFCAAPNSNGTSSTINNPIISAEMETTTNKVTLQRASESEQVLIVLHSYASLAFAPADSAMQMLLSWRTEEMLLAPVLIIFLVIYFFSSALFLGLSLCGDTLLPGLVVGAVIGRLFGFAVFRVANGGKRSSWADPGCFALIGAGSFIGGTTGLTFSICSILMESTGDVQHLLPLMMGITIAKKTAELFTNNVNAILLEAWCVPILDFENQVRKYLMLNALHVMASNVVTLETVCTTGRILDVLGNTRHNAFPVESVRDRTYKGIILRQQLTILLWHVYFTHHPSTCTYDLGKKVEARLFHENRLGTVPPLDHGRLEFRVDLSPYIDHSGFCVLDTTTLPRTYTMFLRLGLRHLTVVDTENRIVGIITRKDLVADHIVRVAAKVDEMSVTPRYCATPTVESGAEGNDGDVCGPLCSDKGLLNSKRSVALEHKFRHVEDRGMMGEKGGRLDVDTEVVGTLMHPSASMVAAICSRRFTRESSMNLQFFPCNGAEENANAAHQYSALVQLPGESVRQLEWFVDPGKNETLGAPQGSARGPGFGAASTSSTTPKGSPLWSPTRWYCETLACSVAGMEAVHSPQTNIDR